MTEYEEFKDQFEDLAYDISDGLITLCVLIEPVQSIMYCQKLANEALYSIVLAMMFGGMEADTIGDKKNREWIANPIGEWIAWANAIRDEFHVWE